MEKSHLVRQLHGLKQQYDTEFQTLIERLSNVTQDVLLRGFGGTPNQHQERRIITYFMELQVEVSVKIGKLQDINAGIGSRYATIISRVEFADLPIPAARPVQAAAQQLSRNKYSPTLHSLSKGATRIGPNRGTPQPVT